MHQYLLRTLLLSLMLCSCALHAETEPAREEPPDTYFVPTFSLGISNPLLVSASLGGLVPLSLDPKKRDSLSVPALRADVTAGLGGGMLAGGLFFPQAGEYTAVSIQMARLQTWGTPINLAIDRGYEGYVLSFSAMGHIPAKVSLGWFKNTEPELIYHDSFVFLFFGVGD